MHFSHLSTFDIVWLVIGFVGQGLFSMRFLLQWIVSERQKKSVIPIQFWYFSLFGGITLLFYAIHKRDPVFIVGQSLGAFIYIRNLYFVYHSRNAIATTEQSSTT